MLSQRGGSLENVISVLIKDTQECSLTLSPREDTARSLEVDQESRWSAHCHPPSATDRHGEAPKGPACLLWKDEAGEAGPQGG